MRTCWPMFALIVCGWAASASGEAIVVVNLSSPANGMTVPAGSAIEWTITAVVSTGDNMGLALISVDLLQDGANPQLFDIPPGVRPAAMEGFDRPAGLSNPGQDGATSGYGGTPFGIVGARNLGQIGGAQNTFGVPGNGLGLNVNVEAGVGQSPGGQVIATGLFAAPAAAGTYVLALQSPVANTLRTVEAAPASSPVDPAAAVTSKAEISFIVCRSGDLDGDGFISVEQEVPAFVNLLLDAEAGTDYARCAADVNSDGVVNGEDVQPFVGTLLLASPRC